jgi:hypothetical protein
MQKSSVSPQNLGIILAFHEKSRNKQYYPNWEQQTFNGQEFWPGIPYCPH